MARKIQHSSDFTFSMNAEQQVAWEAAVEDASAVLDAVERQLRKWVEDSRSEMTIEKILKSGEPANVILARQAQVEAYSKLIDLIVDK